MQVLSTPPRFAAALIVLVILGAASTPADADFDNVTPAVDDENRGTFDGSRMTDIGCEFLDAEGGRSIAGGGASAIYDSDGVHKLCFAGLTVAQTDEAISFTGGRLRCTPPLPPGSKVTIEYTVIFSDMASEVQRYEYVVPKPEPEPDDRPGPSAVRP